MHSISFQPGEWSSAIAKEDMLKIRRLMLEKLFSGWRSETVFLRMVRYKASQILSRMVRRTKGPLWVKESTLVCFHMWFRYIQVKVSKWKIRRLLFVSWIVLLSLRSVRTLLCGSTILSRRGCHRMSDSIYFVFLFICV